MHTHMWKLSVEQLCHKLLFLYILYLFSQIKKKTCPMLK